MQNVNKTKSIRVHGNSTCEPHQNLNFLRANGRLRGVLRRTSNSDLIRELVQVVGEGGVVVGQSEKWGLFNYLNCYWGDLVVPNNWVIPSAFSVNLRVMATLHQN